MTGCQSGANSRFAQAKPLGFLGRFGLVTYLSHK
jgi:hypothetical protein